MANGFGRENEPSDHEVTVATGTSTCTTHPASQPRQKVPTRNRKREMGGSGTGSGSNPSKIGQNLLLQADGKPDRLTVEANAT